MSIFEISTQLRRSLTNTLKRGSSQQGIFIRIYDYRSSPANVARTPSQRTVRALGSDLLLSEVFPFPLIET